MRTVYIFSPHGDQSATHRLRTGPVTTGFRVAADVDESRLTPRAIRLLDMLQDDLSGIMDGDDLVPRARVVEQRTDIRDAARRMGIPGAITAANGWYRCYGESHTGTGLVSREHRFYGLYHAAMQGDLATAINDAADHPGLHVGSECISTPVHVNVARSDEAWRHMLVDSGMARRAAAKGLP